MGRTTTPSSAKKAPVSAAASNVAKMPASAASTSAKMPASASSTPAGNLANLLGKAVSSKSPTKKQTVTKAENANVLRVQQLQNGIAKVLLQAPDHKHPAVKPFVQHLLKYCQDNPDVMNFLISGVQIDGPYSTDLLKDEKGWYHKIIIIANPPNGTLQHPLVLMRNWLNQNAKYGATWIVPDDFQLPTGDPLDKVGAHLTPLDFVSLLEKIYGEEDEMGEKKLPMNWANENQDDLALWIDLDKINQELATMLSFNGW